MATLGIARLGASRLGGFRLGVYQPWVRVLVGGVDQTSGIFVADLSITDELNHSPNTASFSCRGFTPAVGQDVKIHIGGLALDQQWFGGHILNLTQTTLLNKPAAANVAWQAQAIDYAWLLTRRPVLAQYTSQSATAIILDLIARFASGVTTVHVATGLASLDEITFTNEELPTALTRVMERIGGYWYLDYAQDLHAFVTDPGGTIPTITDSSTSASSVRQAVDLSQVATRVTARGGGSNAAVEVAVGATNLPVEDASWYPVGGGVVEAGVNRITYTGTAGTDGAGSTMGNIQPPAAFGAVTANTSGTLVNGTYYLAMLYTTAEGATLPGPVTAIALSGADDGLDISGIEVPTDPKITGKVPGIGTSAGDINFANDGSGGYASMSLAATTLSLLSVTGYNVNPPTVNTAGAITEMAAGATALQVEDLAAFPASGWALAPGGQVFSYTGRSASSGPGTLTGIPASGTGALAAAVRYGTVTVIPHLTGCTGITTAIRQGDPVNIVVTVNDGAAQTAMAAYVGSGDGVHEMFISDGRWGITEATARATAELSLRKNPLVTISLESRDPAIVSGVMITLAMTYPSIAGSYRVQRVTMTQFGLTGAFPLRQIEASSRQYSFEDLLRQITRT